MPKYEAFAKKLKELQADVPKIFEKVAKKGAIKFVKEVQNRTDKEKLVDTGNYKRNWSAKAIEPASEVYGVECLNNVEYASFLEYGHKLRNGKRWKGKFVGELAMGDAEYYCIQQLEKEIEKAMRKQ